MKYDIILSGVGGQGVLSLAAIIATAAMADGLKVRQSEVHGMAQRGGAVQAHLRISDSTIHGDLVGRGKADMILSMEPVESLRYLDYLKPDGILVTSEDPFENIPDYPDLERIYSTIKSLPKSRLLKAKELAKEAGSMRATNMVIIGAAAGELPLGEDSIINAVKDLFKSKGQAVIDTNIRAFKLGGGNIS